MKKYWMPKPPWGENWVVPLSSGARVASVVLCAEFEERHETPVILAVKPKENRPAVQASPRVNGVAENPLTYYFEAPDRKVRHIEVFHDESYLRLCHQ